MTNPKDKIGAMKPKLSLVPPVAVIKEAMAFKDGADKYGAYNWRNNPVQAMIYIDALLRHVFSWVDGEDKAEDSGVDHLAHARACLAILIDSQEVGCLIDDRPSKGKAAEVIHTLTVKTKFTPEEVKAATKKVITKYQKVLDNLAKRDQSVTLTSEQKKHKIGLCCQYLPSTDAYENARPQLGEEWWGLGYN